MSLFGTITPADRASWQRRSLNVLSGILDAAEKAKVGPIDWTVPSGLGVQGRVPGNAADARDLFAAWCRLIGAQTDREYTTPGGSARLRGEARRYKDGVTIVIVCEIPPPLEET